MTNIVIIPSYRHVTCSRQDIDDKLLI